MSSCHDFLMPGAEGGVAMGIELRVAKLSLIKLEQFQTRRKGRREISSKTEHSLSLLTSNIRSIKMVLLLCTHAAMQQGVRQ